MRRISAFSWTWLCLSLAACDAGQASVAPETTVATPTKAEPATKSDGPTPALIASYQDMVHEVYFSDFERCLEEQMEAEETMYMRSAFTLDITVARDGSTKSVKIDHLVIKVRNYEGKDLKDGNAQGMSDCVTTAAAGWEFEPKPSAPTNFRVDGKVGD